MKVLLLAAGRGERMRPLTDDRPKPLLEVRGRSLIVHHILRLAAAGFTEMMVNLSWKGDQIRAALGDGAAFGVDIVYSEEGSEPLETAGGIVHGLHWLGDAPFVVINADIWCDFPFEQLALPEGRLAHLVLVPNPEHNAAGDFVLERGMVLNPPPSQKGSATFSGVGVYAPALFAELDAGKRALAPILREACSRNLVSGELYDGVWWDVGTPERLEALRQE